MDLKTLFLKKKKKCGWEGLEAFTLKMWYEDEPRENEGLNPFT